MGLNDRVSSMRPLSSRRRDLVEVPPPLPEPDYAWRRRPNERVEYAPVTAVRAVAVAQMSALPRATIAVNRDGEPRQ